jgi:hypothetical protein
MSRGKTSKRSRLNASPRVVLNTELSKNELVDLTKLELPFKQSFNKPGSQFNERLLLDRTDEQTKLYVATTKGYEGESGSATLTNAQLADLYEILDYGLSPNPNQAKQPPVDSYGRYELLVIGSRSAAQVHVTFYETLFNGNVAAISVKDSWGSAQYGLDFKELKQLHKLLQPQS